jgi:flagellar biogenesis protein FliO
MGKAVLFVGKRAVRMRTGLRLGDNAGVIVISVAKTATILGYTKASGMRVKHLDIAPYAREQSVRHKFQVRGMNRKSLRMSLCKVEKIHMRSISR